MVVTQELTAEALLAAPRRGAAVPNRNGTLVLYSVSTHDFSTHKTLKEVRIMDVATGSSRQLSGDDKVHDAVWVPGTDDQVMYLRSGDKGLTELVVAAGSSETEAESYVAAKFDAPVANMKLKALDDGLAFVVTGLVDEDGALYNEEAVEKVSTGRVFDTVNIRTWNVLYKAQRYSLWYSKLVDKDGKWKLDSELHCLVTDPKLEAPSGMYDVNDALDHFAVCHRGIAFAARSLSIGPPQQGATDSPFYVALESFTAAPSGKPVPISLGADRAPGSCGNLRISPDDSMIGLIHTQNRDSHNPRLFMTSIDDLAAFDVLSLVTDVQDKDRDPPSSFEFAGSSDSLIIQRAECGRVVLGHLKLHHGEEPKIFFKQGTATAFYPVREGCWDQLLVTSNSLIDSSLWQIVNLADGEIIRTVSSATKDGAKLGLSADMVTELWLETDDDRCFHSFVLRPRGFDENKKYPWILAPHGGPEGAWADGWSTRWNFAALAAQGYVIVCPNISGSVGFGVDFMKRVDNEWGGNPYNDLLRLMQYLEGLPYLDQDKAVLAGASYGGYMISWMMGFDIIEKFCGVIWHDGLYDLRTSILQGDYIENEQSFGGPAYYWSNPAGMEKYNPARPELLRNWSRAPPTLVIHSEKDYRCPITEGLAAFKTLQVQGVPSRFLTFPDECHWVLGAENSLVWHREVWGWIKRCVDGDIKRGDKQW